jgi:hypothetical protein
MRVREVVPSIRHDIAKELQYNPDNIDVVRLGDRAVPVVTAKALGAFARNAYGDQLLGRQIVTTARRSYSKRWGIQKLAPHVITDMGHFIGLDPATSDEFATGLLENIANQSRGRSRRDPRAINVTGLGPTHTLIAVHYNNDLHLDQSRHVDLSEYEKYFEPELLERFDNRVASL